MDTLHNVTELHRASATEQHYARVATLVHRLFRGLDDKDDALVGSLFAVNGVWHRQGRTLIGPAEIAAVLGDREGDRNTIHVVTNLQVAEVSNGGLIATYYLTAYISTGGGPMVQAAILDCRDDIASTPAGLRIIEKSSRRLM